MTSPRFWSDPLNGATYNFGQRLTSTQMNAYVSGLRNIDVALEWNQLSSWSQSTIDYSGTAGIPGACVSYDGVHAQLCVLQDCVADATPYVRRQQIGNDSVSSSTQITGIPAGGWTTGYADSGIKTTNVIRSAIFSNRSGETVCGARTELASGKKVAYSSNGVDFAAQTMNTTDSGVGVTALIYDYGNSVWIAGLSGGSTGKTIETSTDAVTWTVRTNANSNTIHRFAQDEQGTVVGISSASTNKAVRSTDSIAWTEVTLPASASWTGLTYSAGLGKWFAASTGGDYAESADGQTWSSKTADLFDTASTPNKLGSTRNLVVAVDRAGIWVSSNGTDFTRRVHNPRSSIVYGNQTYWISDEMVAFVTHTGTSSHGYISKTSTFGPVVAL